MSDPLAWSRLSTSAKNAPTEKGANMNELITHIITLELESAGGGGNP